MLKIEIKTGNAVFRDDEDRFDPYFGGIEIQRILREVALQIQNGNESGSCMDINGNKVGIWKLDV